MSSSPEEGRDTVEFRFDGRLQTAAPGDTIAGALPAGGQAETSRSAKYRRPRGPYCLTGDCGTCLVRLDGRPNVRACTVEARAGASVERQNTLRPAALDPTALVDRIYARGLDHHKLVLRPRFANQIMQEVARRLAGFGELPAAEAPEAGCELVEVDVLIVGAGPAGRSAARTLHGAGVHALVVDRQDRRGLGCTPLWGEPTPLPEEVRTLAGVFGVYPEEAVWAASVDDLRAPRALVVRPRHVVLATGARDPQMELVNNDLPGVVAARGLLRTLARSGRRARELGPVVVVGKGPVAERAAEALEARRLAPADVRRIGGRGRVEHVVIEGGERIDARLVALAPTPAPASDLAAQAGAAVRWDGGGFAVVRDERGRARTSGPWTLWAAGDVAGWMGPARAAEDGHRVARSVLADLADDALVEEGKHT